MKKFILLIIVSFIATHTTVLAQDAFFELIKRDIRAEKATIITKAMQFTKEESSIFWPIYRDYEFELNKIIDNTIALTKDYKQNFNTMTDKKAKELVKKIFELEEKRTQLKKKYFQKFEKSLSSITAARFLQVENQINMFINLKIALELPLISN